MEKATPRSKVIALVCCGLLLTFMSRGDAQRAALTKGTLGAPLRK
jgi:hypothetical protein